MTPDCCNQLLPNETRRHPDLDQPCHFRVHWGLHHLHQYYLWGLESNINLLKTQNLFCSAGLLQIIASVQCAGHPKFLCFLQLTHTAPPVPRYSGSCSRVTEQWEGEKVANCYSGQLVPHLAYCSDHVFPPIK